MKFLIFLLQAIIALDTKPFQYMNYWQFVGLSSLVKKSQIYNKYIKTYDLFEHYSINRPKCVSDYTGKCQSFIYEIARFDLGQQFVDSQPTLFIMAGIHGDEIVGSNAMY